MSRVLVSLVFALAAVAALAQVPKIGDVPPPIKVGTWLGKDKSAAVQKGKVTVLEFWATWCSPCVAQFPHLNSLAAEAKDVTFVSITNEEEAKVRQFLTDKSLNTRVALDADGATFKAYGVRVIPYTVVIGPDGRIAATTTPDKITADALKLVAQGQDPKLYVEKNEPPDLNWDQRSGTAPELAVAQVILQPSTARSSIFRTQPNSGLIAGDGVNLQVLLMMAYGVEGNEMIWDMPPVTELFRVSVKAPNGSNEAAQKMLRTLLESTFKYKAEWVEELADVAVLRKADGPLKVKTSTDPNGIGFSRHGKIKGPKTTMANLAKLVGGYGYNVPAIDETGLTGFYDINLEWTADSVQGLQKALSDIGLSLSLEKRKIKKLKVSEPK